MSHASDDWQVRSDGLHSRVHTFIRSAPHDREAFEQLALDIARFQAERIPGFARLVELRNSCLDNLEAIPAVPVEAFRLTRIAVHPYEADVVRYETSGTTSGEPGIHAMRRTDTYRLSAIAFGRQALLPSGTRHASVVALLPPGVSKTSSLAAMAQMFMDEFDPDASEALPRWLLTDEGVNVSRLEEHLERAKSCNRPLIVVATAIALVRLLDDLGTRHLDCWPRTVVMPTGGFKGKIKEVFAPELRARVASALGIDERNCVGEYGMTELSSQLYEGCLPDAALRGEPGTFLFPSWLDVCPVEPETLRPVAPGALGLARFVNLANVDSAVCILTQDVIRRTNDGIELLGRRQGATPRGCSLGTEEWLESHVR